MVQKQKPRHFLREWRKHAGLSLEQACERVEAIVGDRVVAEGEERDLRKIGVSYSTLSRIERGDVPYNQNLLELLAEAYNTDPASLIMRDPSDPEGIWSIYDQIPQEQRPVAMKVLSGFKTGTDG